MNTGLLNGPVINPKGRTDVVTSQDQVDDLLESLGF
jgi:chemotaxis protein CheZ